MSPREAAARYADELGWGVFPLHELVDGRCGCGDPRCEAAGKHPITVGWQKTLPGTAVGWQGRFERRGIGLNCATAKAFGLDVDRRHGADVELGRTDPPARQAARDGHRRDRQRLAFPLRASPTTSRCATRTLGPDSALHTRGVGGYLVLPPSPHHSGVTYRWLRDPFDYEVAAAPEWLLERLRRRRGGPIVESGDDGYRIPEGQRYSHLIRFAGLLRSAGLPERAIVPMGLAFPRRLLRARAADGP